MRRSLIWSATAAMFFGMFGISRATEKIVPLTSPDEIESVNVMAEAVEYHGKRALRLTSTTKESGTETLGIIPELEIDDGIIEVELAGEPGPGTQPTHWGLCRHRVSRQSG
ncbi:MAG: hypothetical protein FVQ81_08185 [Candidatus Glassbacteria bacterium]|nr:hypothetical protein [Candidatus Glassbacteria bacterium]